MQAQSLKSLQMVTVRWWNASAYYAVSLAHSLRNSGFPVLVAGWAKHPPIQKAREWQLSVADHFHLSGWAPWQVWQNFSGLKRLIEQEKIQLINAHRPEDHLYAGMLKKTCFPDLPVIRTVSDVRAPKKNPVNFWLHARASDFFIFTCKASLERYQRVWPIFSDRSAIIYSAVDVHHFRPGAGSQRLVQQTHPTGHEVVVGIVGRLSPTKDHATFLKAAAKVAARAPQARFLISGEAVEIRPQQLQALARDLGIANQTIFLDRQPDVRDVIQAIDIGVVASNYSEVVGRVVVEFMAMGKPQVVTQVNALPEVVIDGKSGFVVPPGHPEAMAQRILQLIENPALRLQMGNTARQEAEQRFSLEVFARDTMHVYRQVWERVRQS